MADNTKDLQVKEKKELVSNAEQMKPGLVFTPTVDIFENDSAITLLADMPGVKSEDIAIDLDNNTLTISGDIQPWETEDENDVLIEFEVGKYYRKFTLSEIIDSNKIEAKFQDGVLRLVMPKAEKALPRKIEVSTS